MQRIVKKSGAFRLLDIAGCTKSKVTTPWRPKSYCTAQLAAGYQPREVESDILRQKRSDAEFDENAKRAGCRGTFRMILPPPNVTGHLHLGHALNATVQDVICRHHQQMGYNVEWVPGMDHAGIATQVVVEKKLLKQTGQTRRQLGRTKFLAEVLNWKRQKGQSINDDLKKLGCSLNWNMEYFTMDLARSNAVNEAFVRLFDEGLIKRRNSLVNWSCALESAISDMEVDTMEIKGPTALPVPGYKENITFGRMYNIIYRVCNSEDTIIVSTTRPETMLGDVAVAVHPEDKRYLKYLSFTENVTVWHPFRHEPIPLIFDVMVDRSFGHGAVKITPAHDRFDFEMAERHRLDSKPVFAEDGTVLPGYGTFTGMPRFEARERIVHSLSEMKLLRSVKDHQMNLPICSRSKDVLEYMLRPQWFLTCRPLAKAAAAAVRSGKLRIIPAEFETEWFRWLDDCHDWCVSRQLWWGHRIPAYQAKDEAGNTCWVAGSTKKAAYERAVKSLRSKKVTLDQDEDVLDTWFSSSLLPFSAFNWPDPSYKQHYPLSLMQTGHDILFFWVARMVMLGQKLTGELPFKTILLNGIVCDAHGRKMSKSLGNVVTPQQVVQGVSLQEMEGEVVKAHDAGILSSEELEKSLQGLQKMFPQGIEECGTDALRFTLCSHNIKSHFINFDVAECSANRKFLNKIWQAARYTLGSAQQLHFDLREIESMNNAELGLWDRWVLSRLAQTLQLYGRSFESYSLHQATGALKQFLYGNLCDIYLETTKANIRAGNLQSYIHCATLATCLSWSLQAMLPFTPYVSQKLLQYIPHNIQIDLGNYIDVELEAEIDEILGICQAIRQLKSRNQIAKKHEPVVYLFAANEKALARLNRHLDEINALALCAGVHASLDDGKARERKKFSFFSTAGHLCSFGITTNNSYKQTMDTQRAFRDVNRRKLKKLESELSEYRQRCKSDGYRRSASEEIQRKHMEKMKQLEVEIKNIKKLAS